MLKKRSNIIERSIEKVVLVIAGLGCAYILYAYVLRSPYGLKYDGRTFGAGQLDIYIEEQAEKLKERLNREPVAKPAYEPQSNLFLAKMDSVVNIDTNVIWPVPSAVEAKIEKKYRVPVVGQVNDVAVDYIRAAAYVPKAEITTDNINAEASYEPNDIDLVTVQGSVDVGALAASFQECFAGKELPEDWRNTNLAKPVFAATDLQRQCLGTDGTWGNWEEVPRAKTDPYKSNFRVIEDASALPSGGVTVRLLKLGEPRMQASLLQPEPYRIASAEEEWFPPVIHQRFLTGQREKEVKERRDTIAAEQEGKADERDKARAERERKARPTTSSPGGAGGYRGGMEIGPGMQPPPTTSRTPTRTTRPRAPEPAAAPAEQTNKAAKTTGDAAINEEMDKILLTKKNVSELREPVVFWAFDDTAEPGNSYRYRIRVGVFNPVAGTGQVRAEDAAYDNRVILWGEFSEVTEAVAIPQRLYFFPVNVQETAKSVEVQVCKYALGYWYSEQFMVKRGEVIGKVAKVAPGSQDKDKDKNKDKDKGITLLEAIDYGTGAVLVDLVPINDWSGDKNLQSRRYFDVLYSFDGTNIARIAAKLMYWPDELRARYTEIKGLEKKPKLAFRAWSSINVLGGRRISPTSPTGTGEQRMMDEEYRMRMQMINPGQQ
jgi:hypothetical protein